MHGTIGEHEMRTTNMITSKIRSIIVESSRGTRCDHSLIDVHLLGISGRVISPAVLVTCQRIVFNGSLFPCSKGIGSTINHIP